MYESIGVGYAAARRPDPRIYQQIIEAYLDPAVRAGVSSLALLAPVVAEGGSQRLRADLDSGVWDARFGYLRELPEFDLEYRLLVAG